MIEERTDYTDYQVSLSEFKRKFPNEKSWIENLCVASIIQAYQKEKTNLLRRLDENRLRDVIYRHLRDKESLFYPYLNVISLVKELNEEQENEGLVLKEIRLDLIFYIGSNVKPIDVFVVECKQFDTYDLSYIKGGNKNGIYIENGLERFVSPVYVRKQDKYAGMLGFYKNDTPVELITNLKVKIKEYFPKTAFPAFELQQFSHHLHSFISYHPRENETEITVYHIILPI